MRIARVKLTGFKSFVDPVELRILPGLTGIVGPNGCGKSNLLEAIRWVMGEGSPKSMRGSAMDDVIFAGTATRPQREFAEVSILAGQVDDDDIEVVRRIERGAGSAYRINGRDARARDAHLIFADAATGAHSPALVSQGRIGAIIAAKPAERRAMLEEAAGMSGLHVRRREAEIRLKATEANLARVAELASGQEARIAVLRRQARIADRYRSLSDDIKLAEARLVYARWRDAAAAADAARAEAKVADEAVFAASEGQRTAAASSNEAVGSLAAARTAAQTARDEAADARHRLATVEAERERVLARIADISKQQDALEHDRTREGELARDAGEALVRLEAEGAALAASIAAATAARPAQVDALGLAEEASRAAEVALAQAVAENARQSADRRIAEAALAAAQLRRDRAASALAVATAARDTVGNVEALETEQRNVLAACEAAREVAAASFAAIDSAEAVRADAATASASAEAEAAVAAVGLASSEAEAAALRADTAQADGAIAYVRAAPGYEVALAAALADDLAAAIGAEGARRWSGSATETGDPALAFGEALANHVEAPPELSRRLTQIAVVEIDPGTPLAVGQRVVTRGGIMRRWDGFMVEGAGAAAAEGLKRRNRLLDLEARLPVARSKSDDAKRCLDKAALTLSDADRSLAEARRTRDTADAALRRALRAEDEAALALERARAKAAELNDRIARAGSEHAAAEGDCDAAREALDVLPATTAGPDVAGLDGAARNTRDVAATARSALLALDAGLANQTARLGAVRSEAADWRARSGKAGKRVEDMARRAAALDSEAATLVNLPAQVDAKAAMIGIEAARLADTAQAAVEAERAAEATLRECEAALARVGESLSTAREARAGAQARTEAQDLRRVEMGRVSGERFECPAAMLPEKLGFVSADVGAAHDESSRLERAAMERERLGPVNLIAASELAEVEAGLKNNADEIAELTEAVHRLRGSIGSLNREGRERLRAAFEAVDGHFTSLFGTLFNGGYAHLALIDSDDPLEAGLEIMAQPPGKKLSSLTLLSGGEQALTAVALIFALFLTNPAPLCVLDEVDAPLDDANVERFCDLLDAMARDTDTRYLIVTHNAVTMSRMHRLYGVTMVEQGISRLVSVDLGAAEALLAAE